MKVIKMTVGGSRSISERGANSRLDSVKFEMTAEFPENSTPEDLRSNEKKLWAKLEKTLQEQEDRIVQRQAENRPAELPKTKEDAKKIVFEGKSLGETGVDTLENIMQYYDEDTPEGRAARLLLKVPLKGSQQSAPSTNPNNLPWDSGSSLTFGTKEWAQEQKVPVESWIRDKKYGPKLQSANQKELKFIAYSAEKANGELKKAAKILLGDE